jgi:virginiamycin B lyase
MTIRRSPVLAAPFLLLAFACSGDDAPEPRATATASTAIEATATTTAAAAPTTAATSAPSPEPEGPLTREDFSIQAYAVPAGSHPHDVAPAIDGGVWYTAQGSGELGWLDPESGETREIPLGAGSRPHGVIVGPDGAPWITDGGLNAIVTVDPETDEVTIFPLPPDRGNANLNTAAFDRNGDLWFTGQNGIYGRLDVESGEMQVFDAPRGRGPYGITATPEGDIYYASLAGSYVGQIDLETGEAAVIEPPTAGQGTRRVWSDSRGRIWCSQWDAGQVGVYDPADASWGEWPLPGGNPSAYAVYVDELDAVWLSDFGGDALHRFDPETETFLTFELPHAGGNVRQILGRPGEVWAPESAVDQIFVVRF